MRNQRWSIDTLSHLELYNPHFSVLMWSWGRRHSPLCSPFTMPVSTITISMASVQMSSILVQAFPARTRHVASTEQKHSFPQYSKGEKKNSPNLILYGRESHRMRSSLETSILRSSRQGSIFICLHNLH